MNRRKFMQALGAIGIGGALPVGKAKTSAVVDPAIDKGWMSRDEVRQQEDYPRQLDPVQIGGQSTVTTKDAKLYCKKAGIKAGLISISFSRKAIDVTTYCDEWRQYMQGPLIIDCEIKAVSTQRGKLEWCMFNVAEWVIVLPDKSRHPVKGYLTHYSYNADGFDSRGDTMSLTIQEA